MRAIVVAAGTLVVFAAVAHENRRSATLDQLTAAYIGSAICGFETDPPKFAEALLKNGLNTNAEADRQRLSESLGRASILWMKAKFEGLSSPKDKVLADEICADTFDAVGPSGTLFPGIATRKK